MCDVLWLNRLAVCMPFAEEVQRDASEYIGLIVLCKQNNQFIGTIQSGGQLS